MAHLVFVEDEHGDVVDSEIYCSDQCAKIALATTDGMAVTKLASANHVRIANR